MNYGVKERQGSIQRLETRAENNGTMLNSEKCKVINYTLTRRKEPVSYSLSWCIISREKICSYLWIPLDELQHCALLVSCKKCGKPCTLNKASCMASKLPLDRMNLKYYSTC